MVIKYTVNALILQVSATLLPRPRYSPVYCTSLSGGGQGDGRYRLSALRDAEAGRAAQLQHAEPHDAHHRQERLPPVQHVVSTSLVYCSPPHHWTVFFDSTGTKDQVILY